MVLVAGGTGTLGRHIVRLLLEQGHQVRVLTRERERARDLPGEVEIVTGDVRTATDVAAAVRGCGTVISAVHGFIGSGNPSPEAIDRDGNRVLMGAAAEAGVEHLVLMSVHGASPEHPMSLHRAKYAAEQALQASGLRFTIIRATAFLETWVTVIGGTLSDQGHALVFGPGRNPITLTVTVAAASPLGGGAAQGGGLLGPCEAALLRRDRRRKGCCGARGALAIARALRARQGMARTCACPAACEAPAPLASTRRRLLRVGQGAVRACQRRTRPRRHGVWLRRQAGARTPQLSRRRPAAHDEQPFLQAARHRRRDLPRRDHQRPALLV